MSSAIKQIEGRSGKLTLVSPAVPQATLVQPWATRPDVGSPAGFGGRPCLMTPADVTAVMVDATGQWLPLLAEFTDERRMPWKKFDLPATFTENDEGGARDEVGLRLHFEKAAPKPIRVVLEGGLPRRVHLLNENIQSVAAAHIEPTLWQNASDIAEALYDQHIDLINHLYDHAMDDPDMFFDGPAGGVAAWPLSTLLQGWREAALRDEPRLAFVVKLADTLGALLQEVALVPRKQLTRERRYQQAGRVNEIDATCLRWLARQPGYTVAEKAGAKQQALGIDRVEHADTLENRIVRELVCQLIESCDRYLAENAMEQEHPRVLAVTEFKRILDRIWAQSPLRKIAPLVGIPHPNYVLQRDPRYRPLWKAYVMLLKQNLQRHEAWRWRHRLWAEAVSIAMLASLSQLAPGSAATRSSVLLRTEQQAGRFIDDRTSLGRWELNIGEANAEGLAPGRRVHYVDQSQFAEYRTACPSFPDQLAKLCPDFALVSYDSDRPDKPPRRILAVWTVFDFGLDGDHLLDRCKEIDQSVRMIRSQGELHGVLIQPKLRHEGDRDLMNETKSVRCTAYRLALPLQSQLNVFERFIKELVEMPSGK